MINDYSYWSAISVYSCYEFVLFEIKWCIFESTQNEVRPEYFGVAHHCACSGEWGEG